MKYSNLKVAAIAAAVAGAFASGDASAALTGTYYGGGSTAAVNGIRGLFETGANECASVAGINFYETAATTAAAFSGNQFDVECVNSSGSLALHYDQSGGSWKGLTIFSGLYTAAQADPTSGSANHVTFVSTAHTGCTSMGSSVDPYSGVTVNLYQGCTPTLATAPLNFGFTDVETALFKGFVGNQPVLTSAVSTYSYSPTTWELDPNFVADVSGAEATGYPQGVFAVVFGIAASSKLYQAMQTDQLAAGTLPSTCTVGTFSVQCAPSISTAQYRSLAAESATNLNLGSIAELFTNTVPSDAATAGITLARRDQGSGTQATSNNYFFRQGCGTPNVEASDLLPAITTDSGTGYTVTYNQTTGAVTGTLNSTTAYAIGAVSGEKDNAAGNGLTGAGFLKIDGVYPTNQNAARGLYGMVTEVNLHAPVGANATLIADILGAAQAYSNTGIVNTFTHATSWPTLALTGHGGNPANSYYNNATNNCGGWRSY
jgi:hypothetical protein